MSQTDHKLVQKYFVVNGSYFDLIASVAMTLFFTMHNLKVTILTFIFPCECVNQVYGAIISSLPLSRQHLTMSI